MANAARSSWWGLVQAGLLGARRPHRSLVAAVAVVPALILPPLFTSLPTASASVPRAASSPVLANPPSNIPRTQAMEQACTGDDEAGCDAAVVKGIDDARAAERVRPLQLPAGFASLSTPAQLLVLANLERTDRGLPGFSGLSSRLDSLAAQGAAANADPQGPDGTDWGSNWAGGEQTALLADYDWMYDDGPGSPNLDCPKAGSSGCWDHRENILWDYGPHPSMGAAATRVDGVTSMTELFSSGAPGALDTALPSNAGGTGAGAAQPAPTTESPSARNQVASSPQVPVPPKPAAAGPELHPAHVFHPLAMPADVMPLRLQVSGVPAVPVTRLITLSAPVSGFRLTRTFDN